MTDFLYCCKKGLLDLSFLLPLAEPCWKSLFLFIVDRILVCVWLRGGKDLGDKLSEK